MNIFKNTTSGRILFLLIPVIFLIGLSGILILKLTFEGNVKLKLDYEGGISNRVTVLKPVGLNDKKSLGMPDILQNGRHIKIEKKEGFEKVLAKPRSIDEIMQEIEQEKMQPPPVKLTKESLGKKIYPPGTKEKPVAILPANKLPNLGEDVSYRVPIGIGVKHKIFSTVTAYEAFTKTHYGTYPKADFDKEMVIILISDERYPSKIFEIVETKTEKDKIVIEYRINVFKMAEEDKRDYYPATIIRKSLLKVELKEVI